MGNVAIQTTLVTPGQSAGLQNLTDNYMNVFKGLVQIYIPGLTNFYKGLRPITSESVKLPCLMVQPVEVQAEMRTTAKYHKEYPFDFWFGVGAETVDEAIVRCTDVGEIFQKLFSNNALNDAGTPAQTNQFKTMGSGYGQGAYGSGPYSGVPFGTDWVDSDMSKIVYGVPFKFGRPGEQKFCALGCFTLKLETQKLV